MSQLERFLARLGIAPFDAENELHLLLFDALKDADRETHIERLIITRGVLARAHEDAATAVGSARTKYETTLKAKKAEAVIEGKSVAVANVLADVEAQEFRNQMHEAEALWRSVKEFLRTVDKDFDKTRSVGADARQQRAAETRGGQL